MLFNLYASIFLSLHSFYFMLYFSSQQILNLSLSQVCSSIYPTVQQQHKTKSVVKKKPRKRYMVKIFHIECDFLQCVRKILGRRINNKVTFCGVLKIAIFLQDEVKFGRIQVQDLNCLGIIFEHPSWMEGNGRHRQD